MIITATSDVIVHLGVIDVPSLFFAFEKAKCITYRESGFFITNIVIFSLRNNCSTVGVKELKYLLSMPF